MAAQAGLPELRSVPLADLPEWVGSRFPEGAPPQWWLSVFESIEIGVSPFQKVAPDQRKEDFELGATAVTVAVDRGDISPSLGAYWLLRLAAMALRINPPVNKLPEVLTPDGSAEWALEHLSLSREQAVADARGRRAEYDAADDDFYAPVGVESQPADFQPDHQFSALHEVEMILGALPWVSSKVTDPRISAEVQEWLDTRALL
ncbi:hypothetical protein ETD86_48765 [Nonomuraea turkmeniaca]|uniref:Uncharacterized protein n=1 Tax=Nonomuraea turkmeniaca TaxID=103838 RepID=A0A5S4EX77_9ACTN|nr:hypothetical protein [Nonomuraea turkmeniaca]TMR08209.1 hypothetical protein ETD86_48765 [Nonomuraea turkmeniaca]